MSSLGNHTFGGKKPLRLSKSAFSRKQSARPYSTVNKEIPDFMGATP
jgi:hypothetical protein